MELHQLRYFVQVAKLGSVSQAAETLHVSQPALSRSITKLEEELGATLFDRVGRRVLLNDRGRMYLRSVEGILRGLSEANAAIGGVQTDVEGSVNVGVFGSQSQAIECISGFMTAHPRIFVSFDARQQSMTSQVTREFDMVYYPAGPGFENIGGIAYATNHLMVCLSDMHPLAQAGSIDLVQLKDEPFIFMNTTAGIYEHSFKLCLEARVPPPTPTSSVPSRFPSSPPSRTARFTRRRWAPSSDPWGQPRPCSCFTGPQTPSTPTCSATTSRPSRASTSPPSTATSSLMRSSTVSSTSSKEHR